ncbi:hypothetical protein F5883DRAFT_653481 [Diaporthe sp. PMI_573]|nr:hypothetical protein F5883DRAFT_653481 [Diaporthaceae sp. PMI_573]
MAIAVEHRGYECSFRPGSRPRARPLPPAGIDVIFEINPTPEDCCTYDDDVKSLALDAGRNPDHINVFILFVGETSLIARENQLYAQGILLPEFVGTASKVDDQIEALFTSGKADGFILSASQLPWTFDDIVDQVIPKLQCLHNEYRGTTLRLYLGTATVMLSETEQYHSILQSLTHSAGFNNILVSVTLSLLF